MQWSVLGSPRKHDTPGSLRKRMVDVHIRPLVSTTIAGLEKLITRLDKQQRADGTFFQRLHQVSIRALTGQPWGTTAQQHFFWYRLTIGALPVRDRTGQLPSCPHEFCRVPDEPTILHIMWTCTGAQRVWNSLYHRWSRSSATVQIDRLADYATRLATPPVATDTRIQMYTLTQDDAAILRSTRRAWRVACGAVAQSIWLQRDAAVFSDHFPNVFEHEGKALRAAQDQILALGAHLRATISGCEEYD
jgi:hypothetical protein